MAIYTKLGLSDNRSCNTMEGLVHVLLEMLCFVQIHVLRLGLSGYHIKTRMTTFIKTKFKKPDDQTNIDNIE